MNIYLDIDGVLLDKHGILANHAEEFLEFMIENHEVFWLTTHCHGGECDAIDHISAKNKISPKMHDLLRKIKMTDWRSLKTDAIDFSKEFSWIDDYVMDAEKRVLMENNAFLRLHEVSLIGNPDLLVNMMTLDYTRGDLNVWQEIGLDISFSKEEFELIKMGFHSDKGMDERWRFAFYVDTLYIMRHWTGWVNYKLKFEERDDRYFIVESYQANFADERKDDLITFSQKNWSGVFIIWLIERYLLKIERPFFYDPTWFQLNLKISIDSIHGYNHWKNVEKIGHYIAERNGADKEVISAFAFLHDIGRTKESEESGHGSRSHEIIRTIFSAKELGLSAYQFREILNAVADHDRPNAQSDDITIQTCWDADRLDLPRVYIFPDREMLYTKEGKSEELFDYFNIGK